MSKSDVEQAREAFAALSTAQEAAGVIGEAKRPMDDVSLQRQIRVRLAASLRSLNGFSEGLIALILGGAPLAGDDVHGFFEAMTEIVDAVRDALPEHAEADDDRPGPA